MIFETETFSDKLQYGIILGLKSNKNFRYFKMKH
jgi:hypothetical protein